jgi:hypothetical protein
MLLAQLREISTDSVNECVDVLARRVAMCHEARPIQHLCEDPARLEPRLERRAIGLGELREHHVRRVRQRLHRCDPREPFREVLGIRVVVCEPLDVVSSAHRHAAARIPDCRICFAPSIARATSALSLSGSS